MSTNSAPDIYLMKREKSRTGCMTVLVVAILVCIVAAIFGLIRWRQHQEAESAPPVEFPVAPVEADLPSVTIPEPSESQPEAAVDTPTAPEPAADAESAPEPPFPAVSTEPAPSAETAGQIESLFAEAREQLQQADYQAARQAALKALALQPGHAELETFLSELAIPLLASRRPMPGKVEYTVQSGDYLGKLAATYNTPVALIAKANDVQGANIRIGQRLLLLDGNTHLFALHISKSRNDLLLTLDGDFFKRYRVSTGENAKTPTGTCKIIDKIARPAWHKPGQRPIPYGDPENLLGTHWLALDLPGYGIHGTWEPETLGRQSSAGCIRMLNSDVEELYTILPKGTLVTIIE